MVAFFCNEGLIPEGQINTTCASNGSWTPNPADLICIEPPAEDEGLIYIHTLHVLLLYIKPSLSHLHAYSGISVFVSSPDQQINLAKGIQMLGGTNARDGQCSD